jgi:hypothetical protein
MTATPQAPNRWVRLDGEDHDGTIEAFELFSARRALGLLKHKLGRLRLLELLQEEIEAGNAFLRAQVQLSAGQEITGTTTLRARGITAAQFTDWLSRAFGRENVLLAAHPEHYSIHRAPGRDVNIVETLGNHVCSFLMRPWDDSVVAAQGLRSAAGGSANARRPHMVLEDGTVVGSVSTAFDEEVDELTARLSVTLPGTCGPLVEQHLEHFAVEFRNWILLAAAEQTATV